MKTVKWGLSILCVLLALFGGHEAYSVKKGFGKKCYLKLFPSNEFRGKHLTLKHSKSYLYHGERSLRTVGDCCWRIYQ